GRGAGEHRVALDRGDEAPPERNAAHEGLRPVDRVEQPGAAAPARLRAELLAHDGVPGKAGGEPIPGNALGLPVAEGDRRSVALPLDGDAGAVMPQRGGSHEPGELPGRLEEERRIAGHGERIPGSPRRDRKSTRLNSSHVAISYAVFCLKKKK